MERRRDVGKQVIIASRQFGMLVSVESCIGEKAEREGVKLEEEVLVTEARPQLISRFPFEDELVGMRV